MTIKKEDIIFGVGLLFAIWFTIWGWVWAYWINIFVAYPFGLISFFIWLKIKKDKKPRNKFISNVLIIGLVISVLSLIAILLGN